MTVAASEPATLADEMLRQQQRVRELIPFYAAIPTGAFAVAIMQDALRRAEHATIKGDVLEMLRVCEELKGFGL